MKAASTSRTVRFSVRLVHVTKHLKRVQPLPARPSSQIGSGPTLPFLYQSAVLVHDWFALVTAKIKADHAW